MGDFDGGRDSFANNTRLLKDLARILVYLAAVILLGALLAPPLYWLGQAVAARGILAFLAETPFQKFFNRGRTDAFQPRDPSMSSSGMLQAPACRSMDAIWDNSEPAEECANSESRPKTRPKSDNSGLVWSGT